MLAKNWHFDKRRSFALDFQIINGLTRRKGDISWFFPLFFFYGHYSSTINNNVIFNFFSLQFKFDVFFVAILQNADSLAVRQLFEFFFSVLNLSLWVLHTYRQYFSLGESKKVKNTVDNNGKYKCLVINRHLFFFSFSVSISMTFSSFVCHLPSSDSIHLLYH